MANFKEALEYAANHPDSDWAKAFGAEVATGKHDAEAKSFGIDTTPIKQHFAPIVEKQTKLLQATKDAQDAQTRQDTAGHGLEGFAMGVAKSGLKLFKGLSNFGTKIGNALLPKSLELKDLYSEEALKADAEAGGFRGKLLQEKNLEGQSASEKVGSFAGDVSQFFIPAGKVAQVEKVLSEGVNVAEKLTTLLGPKVAKFVEGMTKTGVKATVRAAEGGGMMALQNNLDPGATASGAIAGAAVPIAGKVLKPVVDYAKKGIVGFGKRLAGVLGQKGTSVIDEIIKDPKAALEGLSGKSMDTLSKDAQLLKEAQINAKTAAGKEYHRVLGNLQEIYTNEGKSFDKGTEINKITDLLKEKFGIIKQGDIPNPTGEAVDNAGKLDFESSRFISPGDIGIINRAMNAVKAFRGPWDPQGIEGLASKIDKLKGSDPELNGVVHTFTSSLRDSVAKMGAEAGYTEGANLAKNFAQAMDHIDTFQKMFKASPTDLRLSVGADKAGPVILPETEKMNIVNDLSTLFSGNKDFDKANLVKIFGGQELLSREAGRTLLTAPEKGSTKISELLKELVGAVLSPARVGKIVAKTSLTADQISKFSKYFEGLDPAKRAVFIKLFGENNND